LHWGIKTIRLWGANLKKGVALAKYMGKLRDETQSVHAPQGNYKGDIAMNQIFSPGQTVYLLYWRRPEDPGNFTRVGIWLTKKGRDNAMVDYLAWGLIVRPFTWEIPPVPTGL